MSGSHFFVNNPLSRTHVKERVLEEMIRCLTQASQGNDHLCEPQKSPDDGWRISDALWERIEPPWPPRKPLPLGDHNQRIPDRRALDTTFLVLRSACQ